MKDFKNRIRSIAWKLLMRSKKFRTKVKMKIIRELYAITRDNADMVTIRRLDHNFYK